jgi:hydroxymethylpyrimidine kinase/phosphomethylpyrimidine kinase/thiamine-phosphate diphosphorylase
MAKSAPALPAVLLIGGLDPQGCAGILADSQTVSAHGCHPVPLLTCLTEQTSKGLTELGALTTEQFMNQYHAAVADFDIKTIKVGLVPNSELALHVLSIIKVLNVPVIWDPVLASSSGGISVSDDFQQYLIDHVLSHINLLTPNSIELAQLAQDKDVTKSTQHLLDNGLKSCLVKGGHSVGEWATDYFNDGEHAFYCYAEKQDKQVRGTGCVLAASIACNLALKHDMRDAIVLAKAYLTRGIRNAKPAGPYQLIAHSSLPFELPDIPKLT